MACRVLNIARLEDVSDQPIMAEHFTTKDRDVMVGVEKSLSNLELHSDYTRKAVERIEKGLETTVSKIESKMEQQTTLFDAKIAACNASFEAKIAIESTRTMKLEMADARRNGITYIISPMASAAVSALIAFVMWKILGH